MIWDKVVVMDNVAGQNSSGQPTAQQEGVFRTEYHADCRIVMDKT